MIYDNIVFIFICGRNSTIVNVGNFTLIKKKINASDTMIIYLLKGPEVINYVLPIVLP